MENTQGPLTPATDILDDIEYTYQQASASVRFCNLLIDELLLNGLWGLLVYTFPYPIAMIEETIGGDNTNIRFIVSYLLAVLVYSTYYTAFETLTGGKTIGKYITRTRAVTADGTRLTFKTALVRSLCRFIPLEPFSAFGKPSFPWHDRLTKTLVVDEQRTHLPPWD